MFTVSFCSRSLKEPECVHICPSPCLVPQITEVIRWSEQWIPSSLGCHRCSLSQQGLIHQSCSLDTHITLCCIQMELSRNSNVFTSLCQLWAAFSGTCCMQQWVPAEHLLSLWEVFDFCSPFSCHKAKRCYKRWFQCLGTKEWQIKSRIITTIDVLYGVSSFEAAIINICTMYQMTIWKTTCQCERGCL